MVFLPALARGSSEPGPALSRFDVLEDIVHTLITKNAALEATVAGMDARLKVLELGSAPRDAPQEYRRTLLELGETAAAQTRIDGTSIETAFLNVTNLFVRGSMVWHGIPLSFVPAPTPVPTSTPTIVPSPAPTAVPASCLEWYQQGASVSKAYKIRLQSSGDVVDLYCDMGTVLGGWTLMEKETAGTGTLYGSGGAAVSVGALASPGAGDGKLSDQDMKAVLGPRGGTLLWRNLELGTHMFLHLDSAFVSAWSSTYR